MRKEPITPALDFTTLPQELAGQWVLLRFEGDEQTIVSSGWDIREVVRGFPVSLDFVLTRVPREYSTYIVQDPG